MTPIRYRPKHQHLFSEAKKCSCGQSRWGIAKIIGATGQVRFPWYCRGCGKPTNIYEPKHDHLLFTMVADDSQEQQCERCGRMGAQRHHWAPQSMFEDAEEWPTAYLCQGCHDRWHIVVTPQLRDHYGVG